MRAGREGVHATAAITTILFHRLSLIGPDKLLKELLSDRCWYAARKQPSVSVSQSITLSSCGRDRGRVCVRWRGGEQAEQQRAAVVDTAVDGSLDFPHLNGSRAGVVVLYITSLQQHYHHHAGGARSDSATT